MKSDYVEAILKMMMSGTGKIKMVAACAAACILFAGLARAELSATVDRQRVSMSDLLTLTVRLSGSTSSQQPDLSALQKDFEIIDQNSRTSSSVTIVNGQQTSETHVEWRISLRPKREGKLTIPRVRIGNESTRPITVEVTAPSASDQARGDRIVFFDTGVDTSSAYVQEQIIYTVKLYYTESISGDFPSPPDLENAIVETLENEKRYESIVNNRRYYVLEKRYAIFPQRSGELKIPRETFVGSRGQGGLFSQRERVSALSRAHTVEVKPRPASFPGNNWLPAKSMEISQHWNENPPELIVGEPVNRTVTIKAKGVTASLLPQLDELEPGNAKTYKDPPDTETSVGENGILARRTVTTGIVPTEAGMLTIPEIRIPWWNTETDSLEQAVIPGSTYEVKPAPGPLVQVPSEPTQPPRATDADPDSTQVGPTGTAWWQYIAIGVAILWMISTAQWLIVRRDLKRLQQANGRGEQDVSPASPDETTLFKAFSRACREGDPVAAQQRLYQWVRTRDPRIDSLRDFAVRAGEHRPALEKAIRELEQSLYAPDAPRDTSWNGERLLKAITDLRRDYTAPHHRPTTLAPTLNP